MDDPPYRAEYSKSNRAACKMCKEKIDKDVVRLAVMVQSHMFDGKVPNWHHYECFWKRHRPKSLDEIGHVTSLRWEDKERIEQQIQKATGMAGGSTKKAAAAAAKGTNLADYVVEYAKSGRSVCRGCEAFIPMDDVRIAKKEYTSERAMMYGPMSEWYHLDCFSRSRETLEFFVSGAQIPGYSHLDKQDQAEIRSKLPAIKNTSVKTENGTQNGSHGSTANIAQYGTKLEADKQMLKRQSELLYKYRDWLSANLKKKHFAELLELNDQEVPEGESRILDRLTDCMAFGALEKCAKCSNGQFVYNARGYICQGNISEWTKCDVITKEPKRKPFVVPVEYHDYDFLAQYKCNTNSARFIEDVVPKTPTAVAEASGARAALARPPGMVLGGMKFAIVGRLKKTKADLTRMIEAKGGRVSGVINAGIAAVISTPGEVEKMSANIEKARGFNVHIISEEFLDDLAAAREHADIVKLIVKHNIGSWGSDPQDRIVDPVEKRKRSELESRFVDNSMKKVKLTVKDGCAVEPDSDLADRAHVYKDKRGEFWQTALNKVNVTKGSNSYYKMQLLEDDAKRGKYWVFRAWGRIGTTIGGTKLEEFDDLQDAMDSFETMFLNQTGNEWRNRKNFQKTPKGYYPVDVDYSQDDSNLKSLMSMRDSSMSKLPNPVKDLVCLIFDIEGIKRAMMEFEIDLTKMPLGKLSKDQIMKAYKVLTEVQTVLSSEGVVDQIRIVDASNRFYTIIPHDFGMQKPPLLNNIEFVKTKTDMLDNLLEIEFTYSMLKDGSGNSDRDPIDYHYSKLKTQIDVLDSSSEEFSVISKYITNTHAKTHSNYKLQVQHVFKIARQGEEKRYKPFKQMPNRQLLWHGSRVTNYAGILSQGLRIAPPEAPVSGYMFGKGIYFADMVSKSANYCATTRANSTGLLLLSEVALGEMYELTTAKSITKLPKGKQSTKGLGRTHPDPNSFFTRTDGVKVPYGPGIPSNVKRSELLYNEYIVYDVAQVNLQYLVQVDFKY